MKNNSKILISQQKSDLGIFKPKSKIKNIIFNKESIKLNGLIHMYSNQVTQATLVMKARTSRQTISEPLAISLFRENDGSFNYTYEKELFFKDYTLNEDIYDLYLELNIVNFETNYEIRVGNANYFLRRKIRDIILRDNSIHLINIYFTFKGSNLSFTHEKIKRDVYNFYETYVKSTNTNTTWLIGEQPFKAQDTGYAFFKFMRINYPKKNVYYVIDFNSPEYDNVKEFGNVVHYKSKEHFEIVLRASHLISSHHPEYLFPIHNLEFKKKIKAKKVFIQHGILGTKNISNIYAKTSRNFDVNMFIVSSEKERKIVIDDLNFLEDEVKITGLSRFDTLFNDDTIAKRQILIIPTWRDWLQTFDKFIASEYYQRYKSLLSSDKLKELCKNHNLELVLCLHPNMQKFVDQFNLKDIKVITMGETSVQKLLKESLIMITDYSSVAFDFSFLERPIIYYQFDTKKFLGEIESHLDIEEDLPGDIVHQEAQLLERLSYYINNNFTMTQENKLKSKQFLSYKDTNNSQRIMEAIDNFEVNNHPIDKIYKSELMQGVLQKLRYHKYYFAIMKRIYRLLKLFPLHNRVVFESGTATQYADAPRYIFEKLLEKYPDREYIWIYNKKIYNLPNNCKVIKRFSWSYYYYLATSKYWVNNQNFPFYITKRKDGIYLQTWHGTPLKRMLFDLDNIYGRDEEYIKRVEQAKQQWSYLLSQSSYATEKLRSAFKYTGEVLELGYPRNDILINEQNNTLLMGKIKNNINIQTKQKVILYAPTFRDDSEKIDNNFTMDLAIDFDKFIASVPTDYVLLLRLHVLIKKDIIIDEKYQKRIVDVSNYSDIQELFLISDILITDYSSVFFDFLNLNRPMIFYAYDLESYQDKLRGFYMDYKNVPGPIVKTEDELYNTLCTLEKTELQYQNIRIDFLNKYAPFDDGKATSRVVEKVFKFEK